MQSEITSILVNVSNKKYESDYINLVQINNVDIDVDILTFEGHIFCECWFNFSIDMTHKLYEKSSRQEVVDNIYNSFYKGKLHNILCCVIEITNNNTIDV